MPQHRKSCACPVERNLRSGLVPVARQTTTRLWRDHCRTERWPPWVLLHGIEPIFLGSRPRSLSSSAQSFCLHVQEQQDAEVAQMCLGRKGANRSACGRRSLEFLLHPPKTAFTVSVQCSRPGLRDKAASGYQHSSALPASSRQTCVARLAAEDQELPSRGCHHAVRSLPKLCAG